MSERKATKRAVRLACGFCLRNIERLGDDITLITGASGNICSACIVDRVRLLGTVASLNSESPPEAPEVQS